MRHLVGRFSGVGERTTRNFEEQFDVSVDTLFPSKKDGQANPFTILVF